MKEGWKMVKLGEIASYSIGLTYKPTDVVDCNGTIVLRSSNIQDSKLDLSDIIRVKTKIKDELYVQNGDILMCSRNGSAKLVGKVATINELNEPMTFGTFMTIIRSIYNPYLFYFFHSNLFKDGMRNSENPMINQITKYMLNDVTIPLPPLEEQHRIVSILDASFEKIDALKKNAEENLKNAKALFQQVLAQELKPKEGWKTVKLGEVCEKFGEYGMSVPSKSFDGIRYIRITDITENGNLNDDYVSANIECVDTNYILQEGDVLFARTGATVGKTFVYRKGFGKCVYAGYLIRYRPDLSKVISQYIYYYTHFQGYYDWVKRNQKAAAQPNISAKLYNNLELPLPPLEEQHRIVQTLDALSEKCRRLEQVAQQTIRECDALKQSILRQAFSGEL